MQEVFVGSGTSLLNLNSYNLGSHAFVNGGHAYVNTDVLLTDRRVSAKWQLLRSKGIAWYDFLVCFSTVYYLNWKSQWILAEIVHPAAVYYFFTWKLQANSVF